MYPSTNNNDNYSFTSSTIQPRTFSSFYDGNNNINHSQPPREHYCPPSSSPFQLLSPHGITFGDGTILSCASSDDHTHQNTNTLVHEQFSNHGAWGMQCALGKNGRVVNGDTENSGTRRSTSKKDRHSKINTARGPRDRRMRLSLEVAKKFFKLQDMLGFDKASKTVEWLLMKSKTGIQELHPPQLIRRSSECEDVSENIDDQCTVKSSSSSVDHKEKKTDRGVRKSAYLVRPLVKETREKARARARERTMVKSNRLGGGGGGDQYSKFKPFLDPDLNLLDSCHFNQSVQSIPRFQLRQRSIDDNSLYMTNNWSPSLFNYQHSGVPNENQFNDFQILGNMWKGNN